MRFVSKWHQRVKEFITLFVAPVFKRSDVSTMLDYDDMKAIFARFRAIKKYMRLLGLFLLNQ